MYKNEEFVRFVVHLFLCIVRIYGGGVKVGSFWGLPGKVESSLDGEISGLKFLFSRWGDVTRSNT